LIASRRHNRPLFFSLFFIATTLLSPLAGCKRDTQTPEQAENAAATNLRHTLNLNGHPITVELAATKDSRNLGLMYRKSMPADAGMIFVFKDEKPLSFWMRNTQIPLDIVYINASGKIVSIKQMKPLDETGVPSDYPAKMALELNLGTAERLGVKVGDVLNIPPEIQNPANLEDDR
jgi:uncharacterized membrane protein (UPF0127 family)